MIACHSTVRALSRTHASAVARQSCRSETNTRGAHVAFICLLVPGAVAAPEVEEQAHAQRVAVHARRHHADAVGRAVFRLRGAVAEPRVEHDAHPALSHDTGAVADADVIGLNFMSGGGWRRHAGSAWRIGFRILPRLPSASGTCAGGDADVVASVRISGGGWTRRA